MHHGGEGGRILRIGVAHIVYNKISLKFLGVYFEIFWGARVPLSSNLSACAHTRKRYLCMYLGKCRPKVTTTDCFLRVIIMPMLHPTQHERRRRTIWKLGISQSSFCKYYLSHAHFWKGAACSLFSQSKLGAIACTIIFWLKCATLNLF